MFLNITDKNQAENNGSSAKLVHYLDKENRVDGSVEQWFSHDLQTFHSYQVRNLIDGNIAKLGQNDAKFFLLNISPSQKEIAHLKSLFGEVGAKQEFKRFTQKMMDEYAKNFQRKGIQSNRDLLWFAKLEQHRYYSHTDKEVKNANAKRGEPKPGEQMHIQVIISRKDIDNRVKLSPKNNSRGTNVEHSKKVGQFDRVAFKASGERVFDEAYHFSRLVSESFKYANTQVNGTLKEKIAMLEQGSKTERETLVYPQKVVGEASEIAERQLPAIGGVAEILLARPDFDPMMIPRKKRKRKKRMAPDQGLNF